MIKNYQTSSPSLVRSGYRDGKVGIGMVRWGLGMKPIYSTSSTLMKVHHLILINFCLNDYEILLLMVVGFTTTCAISAYYH